MKSCGVLPRVVVLLAMLLFALPCIAQSAATNTDVPGWLSRADVYSKIFAAVVAGLGTIFGLPIVAMNFRKTRAEIRKLELEANALEGKGEVRGDPQRGISVNVDHSQGITVQILADPRFLGPLLLLLDFIFAWIVLTLAGYFLNSFPLGVLRTWALFCLSGVLLIPIAREALRVRSVLRPKVDAGSNADKKS